MANLRLSVLGSPYEFDSDKTKDFMLFVPGCRPTDDSVLTIAVGCACAEAFRRLLYASLILRILRMHSETKFLSAEMEIPKRVLQVLLQKRIMEFPKNCKKKFLIT